jgi:hypothetical protein
VAGDKWPGEQWQFKRLWGLSEGARAFNDEIDRMLSATIMKLGRKNNNQAMKSKNFDKETAVKQERWVPNYSPQATTRSPLKDGFLNES